MKKLSNLMILNLIALQLLAQGNNREVIDDRVNPGRWFYILPAPPGGLFGSYYIDDEWNTGSVNLYNDQKIEDYPLKFDLERNLIEIKVEGEVKVLEGYRIKNFEWYTQNKVKEKYVNARDFVIDDTHLIGFYEVLVDGKLRLFARKWIYTKEPDYIEALDMGSKDTKLIIMEDYYFVGSNEAKKIPRKRSDILQFFGGNASKVDQFAKEQKLKFKHREDLIKILEYYNTQL